MYTKYENNILLRIDEVHTAFERSYSKSYKFSGELHNFWEMVYVLKGQTGVSANGKIMQLSENEIVFHKPMEFHTLWSAAETAPHLFIMSFNLTGSDAKKLESSIFRLSPNQKQSLMNLIDFLRSQTEKTHFDDYNSEYLKNWNSSPAVPQTVCNMCETFLLSLLNGKRTGFYLSRNKHTALYNLITTCIEKNISASLTVAQIAQMCGTSEANAKKVFANFSTVGIHKYYTIMKIKKAVEMLGSNLSVSEISEQLGFENQNYFSIAFKREMGYSPLAYKKQFIQHSHKGRH